MFKNRYRIVRDRFLGYETQVKKWWFPFMWFQCYGTNSHPTREMARECAETHKKRVV